MGRYVTLILLVFGLNFSSCSRFPLRTYHYVNLETTWTDAQHYCRENYNDLATMESLDDINRLQADFSYSWAWIGLQDDPQSWKTAMGNDVNSWRWSATGETSKTGYHNWNTGQPNDKDRNEICVMMTSDGKWTDTLCEKRYSFVCYKVTNQTDKTYEFISEPATWKSAQAYCRKHHTDLPTIESVAENNKVYSAKPASAFIWIGLYREPWTWSDKTQSSFASWRSSSPNNYGGNQFCVAENAKHEWDDDICDANYPFICHQVSKLKTVVRMKIQTDADITDPAANAQILQQLGAVLKRQGWTHFNLRWTTQPRKQEEEKLTHPPCI